MPGVAISVEDPGDAIEISLAGEPTHIRLLQFWTAVKNYWDTKVTKIAPAYQKQKAPTSAASINVTAPAASGTLVNATSVKL
jgi:hypothetical protein